MMESEQITKADLDRWEALCEAATPGPWRCVHRWGVSSNPIWRENNGIFTALLTIFKDGAKWDNVNDKDFIEVARTALPRLIAGYRELLILLADAAVPLEALRYAEVEHADQLRPALATELQQEIVAVTNKLRDALLLKELRAGGR